jgi:TatD DNase family protein
VGKLGITDSHCHLFYSEYNDCLEEKLKIASLVGVRHFLSIATEASNFEKNLEIANKYDNVYASIGIHPSSKYEESDIAKMKSLIDEPKIVAIGEVGLDYHYKEPSAQDQINLFEKMLDLSHYSTLPYVFHARKSYPDILDIIKNFRKDLQGVFHCYTDTIENVSKVLDEGFYVSFTGVITFKNADYLREIVKFVPLSRMLVETDCPYLAPCPYRGQTNEPAFVSFVVEKIAEIKGLDSEEVSEVTSLNFFDLFKRANRA